MSKSNRLAPSKHRDPIKESLWRDRVQRQSHSGLSVRGFCKHQLLTESSFYFWRREIQRRDVRADAHRPAVATFVELVAPSAPGLSPVPPPQAAIELLLPLDRRVLIRSGFDASLLRRVLAVLAPVSLPAVSSSNQSNPPALSLSNSEGRSC